MRQRNETVDIAKGLGMILVIIGHCVLFGSKVHNLIFAFHMPLFFILSGLFIYKKPFMDVIKSKMHSLVRPYMLYCFLGILLTCLIASQRDQLTLLGILSDLYLGCPEHINVSSIWFLCTLLFTIVVFNGILQIGNKRVQGLVVIILLLVGLVFGEVYQGGSLKDILPFGRLPMGMDVMPVAIFFVSFGYYGKNMISNYMGYFQNAGSLHKYLLLLGECVLYTVSALYNGRVNLHGLTYNNVLLYMGNAVLGTAILIACSALIEVHTTFIRTVLIYCGRHSVVILGIQAILVRAYVFLINHILHTDYVLYGMNGYHQWAGSLAVSIGSVLFCLWLDALKKIFMKVTTRVKHFE